MYILTVIRYHLNLIGRQEKHPKASKNTKFIWNRDEIVHIFQWQVANKTYAPV